MADKKEIIVPAGKEDSNKNADHDGFFKRILTNPETRITFLQEYFHEKDIDIKDLEVVQETDTDIFYDRAANDVILTTKTRDKYFYIMVEHQSSQDADIAFRLLQYKVRLLQKFHTEYPDKKFPTIYQMVIYNGKTKYDAELVFWNLFRDPEKEKELFDRGYTLIDLQKMDDDCAEQGKFLEGFGKDLNPKNEGLFDQVEKYIFLWYNTMKNMKGGQPSDSMLREIVAYGMAKLSIENRKNLLNFLNQFDEGFMKTIAQSFRDEGREAGIRAGIQQGMQQGMHQREHEIARNMLSKNLSLGLISDVTGLSLEEIKKL